jgi:SRSO17 transposase
VDPDALAIDDTGFPRDGTSSPGVALMYCGALGKRGNCQIGVSVHAVTDWASAAVDWRLFLPEPLRHREKWRLALDMIDETLDWGLSRRPVVADAAYGGATAFRHPATRPGPARQDPLAHRASSPGGFASGGSSPEGQVSGMASLGWHLRWLGEGRSASDVVWGLRPLGACAPSRRPVVP